MHPSWNGFILQSIFHFFTKSEPLHWYIYASPGHSELTDRTTHRSVSMLLGQYLCCWLFWSNLIRQPVTNWWGSANVTWNLASSYRLSCCWPNSQIPECTCSISHNAPFRTEMCTFLFWMEHCGIWNRCILGFVKLVYCWSSLRWCSGMSSIMLSQITDNSTVCSTNCSNKQQSNRESIKILHYWSPYMRKPLGTNIYSPQPSQ